MERRRENGREREEGGQMEDEIERDSEDGEGKWGWRGSKDRKGEGVEGRASMKREKG